MQHNASDAHAQCNMGAPIRSKSHESRRDSEENKLIATVSRASVRVVRV